MFYIKFIILILLKAKTDNSATDARAIDSFNDFNLYFMSLRNNQMRLS